MILVIGGSGFIGSHLLRLLVDKKGVRNLDKRQSINYSKITSIHNVLDLNNATHMFKNISTIVLLAAEHKDDVSPKKLYYDVNVEGAKNVLKLMEDHNINNIIFTSSVAVYGIDCNNVDESHNAAPFNDYGKSKLLAENEIYKWQSKDPKRRSAYIIRPTVVFGENNRGNVYNLFSQIKKRKFVLIGNGRNKKSLAYVRNLVAFINHCLEKKSVGFNVYNYVDKKDYEMKDLVKLISKELSVELPKFKIPYVLALIISYFFDLAKFIFSIKTNISSVRIRKFCSNSQFDASKMKKEFLPPFDLKTSIIKTLKHEFK